MDGDQRKDLVGRELQGRKDALAQNIVSTRGGQAVIIERKRNEKSGLAQMALLEQISARLRMEKKGAIDPGSGRPVKIRGGGLAVMEHLYNEVREKGVDERGTVVALPVGATMNDLHEALGTGLVWQQSSRWRSDYVNERQYGDHEWLAIGEAQMEMGNGRIGGRCGIAVAPAHGLGQAWNSGDRPVYMVKFIPGSPD